MARIEASEGARVKRAAKRRVRLIHWHRGEAAARAVVLRSAGYAVDYRAFAGPETLRAVAARPPTAFVIDLSRLPSHGRDVALALREHGKTRHVPIVFTEGAPEKVQRVKQVLPDASYTTWRAIRGTLRKALASPPKNPVVPSSRLAGYSGTPLPKKLGIKEGMRVGLRGAPTDFDRTLGTLPAGVSLQRTARGPHDLIIWFVSRRRELESRVGPLAQGLGSGRLWIAWPKRASGVTTDVSEPLVRAAGLGAGLVDFKICAIDATWSGLLFTRRKG